MPRRVALLLGLLLASACGTTTLTVRRRAPAEVDVPAGKAVAVAQIEGEQGEALVAELTAALHATGRFQVLERQNLGAALAELKFSAEGYVSDDTAVTFGEMTGARAMVAGRVLAASYDERVDGAPDKCARDGQTQDCTLYTRKARGELEVSLALVETETGHVLAARKLEAHREARADAYDVEPAPLSAARSMMSECRAEIVGRFVAMVAPHDVEERVVLYTDGDLPELEVGVRYATVGDWAQALASFRAGLERARALGPELSAKAQYDVGVALAFSGAYDEGIAALSAAYAADPEPVFEQMIARARTLKDDAARVAEQER